MTDEQISDESLPDNERNTLRSHFNTIRGHKAGEALNDSRFGTIFESIRGYLYLTGRRIFGDRYGFTLFCAALLFFGLSWRIGPLVNDSYTVANGLVAVSEGHLHVNRAVYGPGLDTPGMSDVDGVAYARNYGQIIMALPFLWIIQGLDAVADLRVGLAGGLAVLILGLSILFGGLLDRDVVGRDSQTVATYVGCIVALAVFAFIIRGSTTIEPIWYHMLALQAQTMVAAGLIGVVIYRLIYRIHGRQIGLAAGAAVVFVSPIGLWSTFPKRHILVALGVVVSIYCLYRSRDAIVGVSTARTWNLDVVGRSVTVRPRTRFRVLAYVPVGFVAWVNALEGIILLGALLAIDVPTGGRRFWSLSASWCACIVSLIPMFVTNFLIARNPLESPMTYDKYGSGGLAEQSGADVGGSGGGTATSTTIDTFLGALTVAWKYVVDGATAISAELDLILFGFVRSGYVSETNSGGNAMQLSFLEAMPIAAVLVVLPLLLWRSDVRKRIRGVVENKGLSPVATVDAFVIVYTLAITLVFLPKLGIKAQITVRYLLVLFPLAVYSVTRLSSVQRIIIERSRMCIGVYLTGVLVGGQMLFLYIIGTDAVLDESIQIHAYINLGLAFLLTGWVLSDAANYRTDRIGAVLLGLAGAAGTVLIFLVRMWHFSGVGPLVFPLI